MKKILFIFLFSFQLYSKINGDSATFLEIQPDARGSGMGDVIVSDIEARTKIYCNPAALAVVEKNELNITHIFYFQDLNYDFICFNSNRRNSVGVVIFYTDEIPKTFDETWIGYVDTGQKFREIDGAMLLSSGKRINQNILFGYTTKLIFQSIDTVTYTGFALDLGVIYKISNDFMSGLAIRNAGPEVKNFSLPSDILIGCNYKMNETKMGFGFEIRKKFLGDISFGIGLEKNFSNNYFVRVGYNSISAGNSISGFSFGIGINRNKYTIDYAFIPYGELGVINHISVNIKF